MIRRLLMALSLGLVCGPALADGIEIPESIKPTLGGSYVLRTELFTTNSVQGLQYDVFYTTSDGRIGDSVPGTVQRPAKTNTRAGQKKRVLVRFPSESIDGEQLLALCMWRDPDVVNNTGGSALVQSFRYCKLFTARP